MPQAPEHVIKVTSDDPKDKKNEQDQKDKKSGLPKAKGEVDDGKGEELVIVTCFSFRLSAEFCSFTLV